MRKADLLGNFLYVLQLIALTCQRLLLADLEAGGADLADLKLQHIPQLCRGGGIAVALPQGIAAGDIGTVGLAVGRCLRLIVREGIEQCRVGGFLEELLIVILSVDVDQQPTHLTSDGDGDGLAVEAGTSPPVRAEHAGEHQLALLAGKAHLLHGGDDSGIQIGKDGADGGTALPRADQLAGDTVAKQEIDGVKNDRLARTGLTAENGKALAQVQIQRFDDGDILNMQTLQHKTYLLFAFRVICNISYS